MSYIKLQRAIATNNLSWAMRIHYRKTLRPTVGQVLLSLIY